MYLEVGNRHAIEGYRVDGSEETLYRKLPGERVTRIQFPNGTGLQEMFSITLAALGGHMAELDPEENKLNPAEPAWIESDSPGLVSLLQDHFELNDKQLRRPTSWGKN